MNSVKHVQLILGTARKAFWVYVVAVHRGRFWNQINFASGWSWFIRQVFRRPSAFCCKKKCIVQVIPAGWSLHQMTF